MYSGREGGAHICVVTGTRRDVTKSESKYEKHGARNEASGIHPDLPLVCFPSFSNTVSSPRHRMLCRRRRHTIYSPSITVIKASSLSPGGKAPQRSYPAIFMVAFTADNASVVWQPYPPLGAEREAQSIQSLITYTKRNGLFLRCKIVRSSCAALPKCLPLCLLEILSPARRRDVRSTSARRFSRPPAAVKYCAADAGCLYPQGAPGAVVIAMSRLVLYLAMGTTKEK